MVDGLKQSNDGNGGQLASMFAPRLQPGELQGSCFRPCTGQTSYMAGLKQARKPRSYASSKLCPATDLVTT